MHTIQELEDMLLKVKVELMTRSIFLSAICLSLKHVFTDAIPTAATNGIQILHNPEFFASLSFEERVFVEAHELWHCAFDHFTRLGTREPKKWNVAGDHVINLQLKKDGYVVPKAALCDPSFKGMPTEEVYQLLPNPENDEWDQIGWDMHAPPPGMDPDEFKAKVQENIIKAKLQSEMAGKSIGEIPGEIQRIIDQLLNPVIPWHRLLARFMTEFHKADYSWKRPNRRYIINDVYMPSPHSPTIKRVNVAVDSSGSISQRQFTEIMTEVQALKEEFQPEKMEVIICDYAINGIHDLAEVGSVADLKLTGGGGTSIEPVMDYCKKHPPTCLIYFTDLHFPLPAETPDFPIIWICSGNHEPLPPEWGTTIYLKPNR